MCKSRWRASLEATRVLYCPLACMQNRVFILSFSFLAHKGSEELWEDLAARSSTTFSGTVSSSPTALLAADASTRVVVLAQLGLTRRLIDSWRIQSGARNSPA